MLKIEKGTKLEGMTFVFTGSLRSFTREEAKKMVEELGGRTSENTSRKTNYVVMGEGSGFKADRAKALGVPIINEEEFKEITGKK